MDIGDWKNDDKWHYLPEEPQDESDRAYAEYMDEQWRLMVLDDYYGKVLADIVARVS